ncbi:MAG: sulfurtransferase TusA family protein [Elusimicrobia bacterium]|nr:sulfurtransferase TusA family protein [Elusimicrobiota bacterium]
MQKSSRTLDCVGLFCPMPIMKTKQELDAMKSGEILEILADDPAFEKDLPAWCKATGEKFLGLTKENGIFKGYVKKL